MATDNKKVSVDDFVKHISDGRWHSVDALARRIGVSDGTATVVMDFLVDFGFAIKSDRRRASRYRNARYRISSDFLDFLWGLMGEENGDILPR